MVTLASCTALPGGGNFLIPEANWGRISQLDWLWRDYIFNAVTKKVAHFRNFWDKEVLVKGRNITESWDRENYICLKLTKMGSTIGYRIDYNGFLSKNWPKYPPPPPVIQSMNVLGNYERKNKTNGSPLPFRDQKVDSPYSELNISSTDTLENLVLHPDKRLNCIDPRVVWVEMWSNQAFDSWLII